MKAVAQILPLRYWMQSRRGKAASSCTPLPLLPTPGTITTVSCQARYDYVVKKSNVAMHAMAIVWQ